MVGYVWVFIRLVVWRLRVVVLLGSGRVGVMVAKTTNSNSCHQHRRRLRHSFEIGIGRNRVEAYSGVLFSWSGAYWGGVFFRLDRVGVIVRWSE